MNQNVHIPEVYDFRCYDQVWQRVGPQMEPYPAATSGQVSMPTAAPQTLRTTDLLSAAEPDAQLPGAVENPCCMGTEARSMLQVLEGFIEEELEDQRWFSVLSRQAPAWARQQLREISHGEGHHGHRLMAVYYLITGSCYRPAVSSGRICIDHWCAALREGYHKAACNALNYQRAADGTADVCLAALFRALGEEELRHADMLMHILERTLQG